MTCEQRRGDIAGGRGCEGYSLQGARALGVTEAERREHLRLQTSCPEDCVLCENSQSLKLPDSKEGSAGESRPWRQGEGSDTS